MTAALADNASATVGLVRNSLTPPAGAAVARVEVAGQRRQQGNGRDRQRRPHRGHGKERHAPAAEARELEPGGYAEDRGGRERAHHDAHRAASPLGGDDVGDDRHREGRGRTAKRAREHARGHHAHRGRSQTRRRQSRARDRQAPRPAPSADRNGPGRGRPARCWPPPPPCSSRRRCRGATTGCRGRPRSPARAASP